MKGVYLLHCLQTNRMILHQHLGEELVPQRHQSILVFIALLHGWSGIQSFILQFLTSPVEGNICCIPQWVFFLPLHLLNCYCQVKSILLKLFVGGFILLGIYYISCYMIG